MKNKLHIKISRRVLLLIVINILLSSFFTLHLHAQGSDAGLAALVEVYKDKAQKMYKAQETVMALETTNHIWMRQETNAIYDLQKEFNDYITTFRGVITYAAQVYGFYYEIDKIIDNIGVLSNQIGQSPSNPFAVALSARRNNIYIDIINTASGIINNVRQACIGTKMNQQQRIELIFDIRPRLHQLNVELGRLAKMLKYTNMTDVWREIVGRTHTTSGKSAIIQQAMKDWKSNGKKIKPSK